MSIKLLTSCIGCKACYNICPTKVFSFTDNRPTISRPNQCVNCGHCFAICPVGSISMFGKLPDSEPLFPPNTTLGAITHRRSIRRFIPKPLPNELISHIIDVSKFCPSAGNRRKVQFLVLQRTFIERISAEIIRTCQNAFPGIQRLQEKFDFLFRGAQQCVVSYCDRSVAERVQECAIQVTTIELYAQGIGIGCVWIGYLTKACKVNPGLVEMMGLESGKYEVLSCLGVGYPAIKYKRGVARMDEKIEFME